MSRYKKWPRKKSRRQVRRYNRRKEFGSTNTERKRQNRLSQHLLPREPERMTSHHLTPRSRCGNDHGENLMRLWNNRHELWHMIFRNKTLEEVVVLFYMLEDLFGDRTPTEMIALLQRLARAKKRPQHGYWLPNKVDPN